MGSIAILLILHFRQIVWTGFNFGARVDLDFIHIPSYSSRYHCQPAGLLDLSPNRFEHPPSLVKETSLFRHSSFLSFIMGWVVNASPEVEAQSQWHLILAVTISLTVISIITVCSRIWIRKKARGMAADDWMAALAMVFAIIYSIICIVRKYHRNHEPLYLR
jgi:hypothetical protein